MVDYCQSSEVYICFIYCTYISCVVHIVALKLDSLRWFDQCRSGRMRTMHPMQCFVSSLCLLFVSPLSKTPLFCGVCTQGAMTLKYELGRDF